MQEAYHKKKMLPQASAAIDKVILAYSCEVVAEASVTLERVWDTSSMTTYKGFAAVTAMIVVLGLIVLGGVGYIALNPSVMQPSAQVQETDDGVQTEPGDHQEVDHDANDGVQTSTQTVISWRLASAGETTDGMPQTNVIAVVNGTSYGAGTFLGSCSEIGATGGIDGTGLLAGELSAVQCWYAGGGNEIGVFAHEDGGYQILVGELSEGEAGAGLFRGAFQIKYDIAP